MSYPNLAMIARVAAAALIAISVLVGPSQCNRYTKGWTLEHRFTPTISIGKALIEPIEYKANMILLERLSYIAGSVDILVKFSSIPKPPPLPPRNKIINTYQRKILPMVAMLKRTNFKQKESMISLSLDYCFKVDSVDMVYARSLDDLMSGSSVKVNTGTPHHDHRRGRFEFQPDIGGVKGVPTDGVAKITITYRDAADKTKGSTCMRDNAMIITKGLTVLKPDQCGQIMPCFDNSNTKAKISLALTIDSHGKTKVLTNMPPIGHPERLGYHEVSLMEQTFKQTPEPISMNELVFISSRFDEPLVGSRTSLVVPLGRSAEAGFAFKFLEQAFDWFETYTGYKHPLGSFQLVVVPTVPNNWNGVRGLGISTIMPFTAFLEAETSSRESKLGAALQVGYEIASQWFGIIIEPKSQSDAWITEGLAAFTALKMIDKLMPDLQIYEYFRSKVSPVILELESKKKFPPVTSAEIENLDQDFYSVRSFKSAAIIDMLAHNVARNPSRFDTIIRALIERRAFTEGISIEDLVEALENRRFSEDKIGELLEPWLNKPGFPVIHIAANEQGQICLTQESAQEEVETIWPVSMIVKYVNDDSTQTDHTKRIFISDFRRNNGAVCLPPSFKLVGGASAWIEVCPGAHDALMYFQVKHPKLLAGDSGRLKISEILEAAAQAEPNSIEQRKQSQPPQERIEPELSAEPPHETESDYSSSSESSTTREDSMSLSRISTSPEDKDVESEVESPQSEPPAPPGEADRYEPELSNEKQLLKTSPETSN